MKIPVVDFGSYSLSEKTVLDEQLTPLSKELKTAFTEVGFVYLKNTGISQEEVNNVIDISFFKFFLQSDELKLPFSRGSFSNNVNHGWVSSGTERLNPQRPGDLKEAFNTVCLHPDIKWPSSVFREVQTEFFLRCKDLCLRVLRVMALSLGLQPAVFLNAHSFIGSDGNGTTLRSLYYPPVDSGTVKEGQMRCGEHSDYGSITMVFQSQEGGLQVLGRSGDYISAPSIPGTVLINIADLMQRWTSDTFISAIGLIPLLPKRNSYVPSFSGNILQVHKVSMPPAGDSSTRQSLAFFVQPDDEALITCCDGSDKYPPVKSGTYLIERFQDSYGSK